MIAIVIFTTITIIKHSFLQSVSTMVYVQNCGTEQRSQLPHAADKRETAVAFYRLETWPGLLAAESEEQGVQGV